MPEEQLGEKPQVFKASGGGSGIPKWLFITILVASFVIIIWVAGISAYFLSAKNKASSSPQESVFLNQSVTPTTSPSSTSSMQKPLIISPSPAPSTWKKYKAPLYSISYPPDWTIKQINDANTVQIYDPGTAKKPLNPNLIGSALASKYVLITASPSAQTAAQYVDKVEFACCLIPSTTPSNTKTFQKQSVTFNNQTGMAYTTPGSNFTSWDFVFSVNSMILEISSSITSLNGTSIENEIIDSLILNPQ